MKAKVKKTGEIIYAKLCYDDNFGTFFFEDEFSKTEYEVYELELLEDGVAANIDWEQRRYEIAKAAMQGLCVSMKTVDSQRVAKVSVSYAESLIKALKGE